jgi:nucleoside-diphosphate kinase
MERTLALIKPDAVERSLQGEIMAMMQQAGLRIVAMKMLRLSKTQAEAFYAVHRERPFFASLTDYMSSGPIVALCLEGENAIQRYRDLMGATNKDHAAEGTIRKKYALDIERNSCHGSDSPQTAVTEIAFFFSALELVG